MPGVIAGGDKSEARRAGEEGSILGEEIVTIPHQLRVWGNAVSSPMGSGAKPRRPNDFVHFIPIRSHPLDHKISY